MQQTIARSPGIQIVLEVNGGRGSNVAGFLEEIQQQFPLRAIDTVGNLHRVTITQILAAAGDDVMLYLARP